MRVRSGRFGCRRSNTEKRGDGFVWAIFGIPRDVKFWVKSGLMFSMGGFGFVFNLIFEIFLLFGGFWGVHRGVSIILGFSSLGILSLFSNNF